MKVLTVSQEWPSITADTKQGAGSLHQLKKIEKRRGINLPGDNLKYIYIYKPLKDINQNVNGYLWVMALQVCWETIHHSFLAFLYI